MRKRLNRLQVKLADISHDWGETHGGLVRKPGERFSAFALRLTDGDAGTLAKVLTYRHAIRRGAALPPVFVIAVGTDLLLVDGNHRARAVALLDRECVDAVVARARSLKEAGKIADAFWEREFADDWPTETAERGAAPYLDLAA